MIQQPALSQAYSVYVKEDLRLAILYVKDAVKALMMLHDAEDSKLGSSDNSVRRVYNIGSIKGPDGRPPTAGDIEKTVNKVVGADLIDFKPDAMMDQTVRGFGILDDSKAQKEWGWKGDYTDLSKVVEDFVKEVKDYPGRLQRLELFG
jgi:threonine 3-dehydrogenase